MAATGSGWGARFPLAARRRAFCELLRIEEAGARRGSRSRAGRTASRRGRGRPFRCRRRTSASGRAARGAGRPGRVSTPAPARLRRRGYRGAARRSPPRCAGRAGRGSPATAGRPGRRSGRCRSTAAGASACAPERCRPISHACCHAGTAQIVSRKTATSTRISARRDVRAADLDSSRSSSRLKFCVLARSCQKMK